MEAITREEINELYQQGHSKQEAKYILKKQKAVQAISEAEHHFLFGREEEGRDELIQVLKYLVERN